MTRTVFHVDMDAFFVSVEELFDPSLKGKPVVVGGKANQRGVVSAASYAARKFGVHSAMPLRTAAQLCPHAIFLEGHPSRYREFSRKVFEVLNHFSPKVEMASIDEAYLDLTGTERLLGPPLKAARSTARCGEARHRTELLHRNRNIATAGEGCSDQAKPNGMLWIPPGRRQSFLAPLDVRRIPGVGGKTEASICSVRDHARWRSGALEETFLESAAGEVGARTGGQGPWARRRRVFPGRDRRSTTIRNRSAMSTRSTRTPRCRSARIDSGEAVADGRPASAGA